MAICFITITICHGQDTTNLIAKEDHFTDTISPSKKHPVTFDTSAKNDVLHFPYNKKRVRTIAVTNVTALTEP